MITGSSTGEIFPDVTVGLPVYNGSETIARAIEAILGQTYKHLRLVISDNASTDGTKEICRKFAAHDTRVEYIRHKDNMGALNNFRFVLSRAETPFFAWAAHDDWLALDTIEHCRKILMDNPGSSAALPVTIQHKDDGTTSKARGASPIRGPAMFRLMRFLLRPADNSRYYGLFHTDQLRKCFPDDLPDVPGADWVVSALTLVMGGHVVVPGAYLHRSAAEPGRYARHLRSGGVSKIDRYLPTASMSRELLRHLPLSCSLAAIPSLLILAAHQALWLQWVNRKSLRQGR